MADSWCVYEHIFPNGKKYIGISSNAVKRWRNGDGYRSQGKVWNAIDRYGWDNVKHNIIIDGISKEQAEAMEQYLISELDTIDNGYNTAIGGKNVISTYLNEHILYMIRKSKEQDSVYGYDQNPDDIVSLAERGKSDKRIAGLLNQIDEYLVNSDWVHDFTGARNATDYNVDAYWSYVAQMIEHGKVIRSYQQMMMDWIFGKEKEDGKETLPEAHETV